VLHPLPGDVTDPPPVELEVGFVGLDGRQVRMGLAEGVPVRFEAVAPVRAFPSFKRQRYYFPGLWWSATTRRHVGYESWLERDHLMLLDHDPKLWIGPPDPLFHRPPHLADVPKIVVAQRAHLRLLHRHGPAATYDAVLTGFLICAHRWDAGPTGDTDVWHS
jgi:hypothetical protein